MNLMKKYSDVKGGCKMQEIGGLKLSVFLHFLYTHFINLLRKW